MLACRCLIFTLLVLAVDAGRCTGGGGAEMYELMCLGHHSPDKEICSAGLSDGPKDAAVEIRIGSLPPSTGRQPVYLSFWAARQSEISYSPLIDPIKAKVYPSGTDAYDKHGDPQFNGGKVRVSDTGEATIRVRAPATYTRRHDVVQSGDSVRDPHVHFKICGQNGVPQKIMFTSNGTRIQGGCHKQSSETVSYTILSARDLNTGKNQLSDATQATMMENPTKDWDAIEFSPVYQCLEATKLFDQFSSECSAQCPAHADLAHGQCVRKNTTEAQMSITATWRLQLDCNDKCWADAIPTSRHMVRLALADHLDITFQEASAVKLRRDSESPTTHANLKVTVNTRRLDEGLGSSLMASFLPDAKVVTDLLGLTVHKVTQVDAGETSFPDATLPGEVSDQYAEYYAPLASQAEQRTRTDNKPASIAGVDVPEGVPVGAIIGIAAGVVFLLIIGVVWLHFRRKQLPQKNDNASDTKVSKEDENMGKEEEIVGKVEVEKTADCAEP